MFIGDFFHALIFSGTPITCMFRRVGIFHMSLCCLSFSVFYLLILHFGQVPLLAFPVYYFFKKILQCLLCCSFPPVYFSIQMLFFIFRDTFGFFTLSISLTMIILSFKYHICTIFLISYF